MNKIFVSISLLLLLALAVTACAAPTAAPAPTSGPALPTSTVSAGIPATGPGTGTPNANSPATGSATGSATPIASPGAGNSAETLVATSAATTAATSASGSVATGTPLATGNPTVAATAAAGAPTSNVSTAVAPVTTGTATMGATAAATTAPSAGTSGTPVAGLPSQYVRLSILLQSTLLTGNQSGRITGVVITQPTAQSGAAATPTASQFVPYVRYVVADFGGSNSSEMVLPFQMFSFSPVTSSASGVSQNFTLKGTSAVRTSAPRVSLPANSGVLTSGWDNQVSQYWASNGFAIPVTGPTAQLSGTDVLLRNNLTGANIVGPNNQSLGAVSDFLVDPNNGQFVYAVFNGGSLFGNRLFIVPVRLLIFQFSSASAAGLGNIQLNFPSAALNAAPFINSLNQVPLDPTLLQQFNNFWQNLQK